MKISFPLDNGVFQFDGTFEEFEKLLNTQLTIDDVGKAIDDTDDDVDDDEYNKSSANDFDLETLHNRIWKALGSL